MTDTIIVESRVANIIEINRGMQGIQGETGTTPPFATQAEAEAGAINNKGMTPLRSAQQGALLTGLTRADIATKVIPFERITTTDGAHWRKGGGLRQITDAGGQVWSIDLENSITANIAWWGVVGDGVTDDATPFQQALDWLAGDDYRSLTVPPGLNLRLASGVTLTGNKRIGLSIIMESPIKPDADIGDAVSIFNVYQGTFILRVDGGGQTANYALADPVGADQAFVARGVRNCNFTVFGRSYEGRVFRTKEEIPGELKTSFTNLSIYTGDSAAGGGAVSAGCGQPFFIEGTTAWGGIQDAVCLWDDYGPVFSGVSDIVFDRLDVSRSIVFDGCTAVWGNTIAVGDETLLLSCVQIINDCIRIAIDKIFVVQGGTGVLIEDCTQGNGEISIGEIATSQCANTGLKIDNARNIKARLASDRDAVPLQVLNNSTDLDIELVSFASTGANAIVIGSGVAYAKFSGEVISGGSGAGPVIDSSSTSSGIIFDNFMIRAGSWTGSYNLPASNRTSILGGFFAVAPLLVGSLPETGSFRDGVGLARNEGVSLFNQPSSLSALSSTPRVQIQDEGLIGAMISRFGANTTAATLAFLKSRGVFGAYSAPNSGDSLAAIRVISGAAQNSTAGFINFAAAAAHSGSSLPTRMSVMLCDVSSTSAAEVLRLEQDGGALAVGATVRLWTAAGHLRARSYTHATCPGAANDGEMIHVSDGRAFTGLGVQEGPGAGTGVFCVWNNSAWRVAGTNSAVVA